MGLLGRSNALAGADAPEEPELLDALELLDVLELDALELDEELAVLDALELEEEPSSPELPVAASPELPSLPEPLALDDPELLAASVPLDAPDPLELAELLDGPGSLAPLAVPAPLALAAVSGPSSAGTSPPQAASIKARSTR